MMTSQWRTNMTKTLKLTTNKMKTVDIGKEMKRHLDMLPGMIDKCHKYFVPQVQDLTGMAHMTERFQIEFIEAMSEVCGLRFEMQIDLNGLDLYDLKTLLHKIEALCRWEPLHDPDMCGFTLNGYTFTMGDGDDYQAVYMRNGKLCVWVRAWKETRD